MMMREIGREGEKPKGRRKSLGMECVYARIHKRTALRHGVYFAYFTQPPKMKSTAACISLGTVARP